MGERQLDKLEVTGSSPVAPTRAESACAHHPIAMVRAGQADEVEEAARCSRPASLPTISPFALIVSMKVSRLV